MENMNNTNDLEFQSRINLDDVSRAVSQIRTEAAKFIIGQEKLIDLLITAIFSDGHVLIEGVPGIAKTLAAKIIARTLNCEFKRIQFTPDLMPSDVIGTSVFSPKTNEFEFIKGPIFSNIILIDEINRSPAKTQSALFEVMEERHITADGTTYHLPPPFIVFATQNPIEHEGTYSLPEAQIDRFLFKIKVDYPTLEEEIQIIELKSSDKNIIDLDRIQPVLDSAAIDSIRSIVQNIHIEKKIIEYIAKIVYSTRNNSSLYLGASPRASIALLNSSKAYAAINGRDFVIPEDVKYMAEPVLNHRIIPTPEKEMEGIGVSEIIRNILSQVEAPR